MIELPRRRFLLGLISAPAIVRAASLMPIHQIDPGGMETTIEAIYDRNSLLTINMITKEAVKLWKNSNQFIEQIDRQWDGAFGPIPLRINLLK